MLTESTRPNISASTTTTLQSFILGTFETPWGHSNAGLAELEK